MKVIILQENLHKAVMRAAKIVSLKTQLPILSSLLLETGTTELQISATNLETSIIIKVPARVEEKGRTAVSSKTFLEVISSLSAESISLVQEKEALLVVSGKTKAKINTQSAVDFPKIPGPAKEIKGWKIKPEEWKKIGQRVCFAASTDETRPVLTGIRISSEEKETEAVATDGYRLSLQKTDGGWGKKEEIIIPARAVAEFSQIVGEEKANIYPDKKQNQIIFSTGNIILISRLLEGSFPPFSKIIPTTTQTKVILDVQDFSRAIKTASVFARESANIIKLKVESQKLKVSANAPQVGENETEVEAKIEGEPLQIAFNYRFVLEFLGALQEDQLTISFNGPLSPAVFKPTKDNSFLHVIMPVRLQQSLE